MALIGFFLIVISIVSFIRGAILDRKVYNEAMPSIARSYERDSRKANVIGIICLIVGIGLIAGSVKTVTMFSVAVFLFVCTMLVHLFAISRLFRPMVFGAIRLPTDISLVDFYRTSALLAGAIAWGIPGGVIEYVSLVVFNFNNPLPVAFIAISVSTFLHIISGIIVSGMISANVVRNENRLFTICTNREAFKTLSVALVLSIVIQVFSGLLSGALELNVFAEPKESFSQLLIAVVDTNYGLVSILAFNRRLFKRVFETAHLR